MSKAFLMHNSGETRMVLHAPVIMTLAEAERVIEDLLTAMLRARERPALQEGEIFPIPMPRPEPRPERLRPTPSARTIDDLML